MTQENASSRVGNALAEWFDGFVGSEDEREVADALLGLVGQARAIQHYDDPGIPGFYGSHEPQSCALCAALAALDQSITDTPQSRSEPRATE